MPNGTLREMEIDRRQKERTYSCLGTHSLEREGS